MRIAIFSECYLPVMNGVVTSITTLREKLEAWGHQVYVFTPGDRQPDDGPEIFRLPALPFPKHPYHFARPYPRLPEAFPGLNIDVIHCQHPFPVGRLGAYTARKLGLPMVYTAHTLYDTMTEASHSSVMRTVGPPLARGVVRRFCARADRVIVPSEHTRNALIADGVKAEFAIVPGGVQPLPSRPTARQELRARLDLTDDAPLLLCVGRVAPEKRVDLLLRAVALLKSRDLPAPAGDFRVVVVGDGPNRAEMESLAGELHLNDTVLFTGRVAHGEVGDWYAASDLFVLPSPAETQGLVIIEAMAAGLPCIVVDEGGPKEVVTHEETGLITPFDAAAFADALETALRSPTDRERMGRNACRRAQDFTPERMAQGILAVYHAVK